jgi:hypothetical protein
MMYRKSDARGNVELWSGTRWGLILTVLLIETVGRTFPEAQYPLAERQAPPYDVQYPDPGTVIGRNGYQDEVNTGNRRLDNQVSRISGQELRSLLQRVDVMLSNQCTRNVAAQWEFETNVNAVTQHAAVSLFIYIHPFYSLAEIFIYSLLSLLLKLLTYSPTRSLHCELRGCIQKFSD